VCGKKKGSPTPLPDHLSLVTLKKLLIELTTIYTGVCCGVILDGWMDGMMKVFIFNFISDLALPLYLSVWMELFSIYF